MSVELQNEPWIPRAMPTPMSWDPANKIWIPTPPAPGSIDATSLSIPWAQANSPNLAPPTTVTVVNWAGGSIGGSTRFTLNSSGVVIPSDGVYIVTGQLLTTGIAGGTSVRITVLKNSTPIAQQDAMSEIPNMDVTASVSDSFAAGEVVGMAVVASVAGGSVSGVIYIALLGESAAS